MALKSRGTLTGMAAVLDISGRLIAKNRTEDATYWERKIYNTEVANGLAIGMALILGLLFVGVWLIFNVSSFFVVLPVLGIMTCAAMSFVAHKVPATTEIASD